MRTFTIGFTKKSARQFFDLLRRSGVRRVVDVRLNNVSQLAGFAKKEDLAYFLKQICGVEYVHQPLLAPTDDIHPAGEHGVQARGKRPTHQDDKGQESKDHPEIGELLQHVVAARRLAARMAQTQMIDNGAADGPPIGACRRQIPGEVSACDAIADIGKAVEDEDPCEE